MIVCSLHLFFSVPNFSLSKYHIELFQKIYFTPLVIIYAPKILTWLHHLSTLYYHLQNQAGNLDHGIEDASEHFVYVPRKCTVNAQDIAFFLSTRLVSATSTVGNSDENNVDANNNTNVGKSDDLMGMEAVSMGGLGDVAVKSSSSQQFFGGEEPTRRLRRYESQVASLAAEFEDGMVRYWWVTGIASLMVSLLYLFHQIWKSGWSRESLLFGSRGLLQACFKILFSNSNSRFIKLTSQYHLVECQLPTLKH